MENGEQKNPVTRTAFYVRVTTQEYVRVLKMAEATRRGELGQGAR